MPEVAKSISEVLSPVPSTSEAPQGPISNYSNVSDFHVLSVDIAWVFELLNLFNGAFFPFLSPTRQNRGLIFNYSNFLDSQALYVVDKGFEVPESMFGFLSPVLSTRQGP